MLSLQCHVQMNSHSHILLQLAKMQILSASLCNILSVQRVRKVRKMKHLRVCFCHTLSKYRIGPVYWCCVEQLNS